MVAVTYWSPRIKLLLVTIMITMRDESYIGSVHEGSVMRDLNIQSKWYSTAKTEQKAYSEKWLDLTFSSALNKDGGAAWWRGYSEWCPRVV